MDKVSAPILVLGFSRLDGLISVVESAIDSGARRIYCALDGSRNIRDFEIQESIVKKLAELASLHNISFILLRRSQNLGLAVAIVSAIDVCLRNEDWELFSKMICKLINVFMNLQEMLS